MATKKKTSQAAKPKTVKAKPEKVEPVEIEHTFSKSQLVGSKRFANRRDILSAMLSGDRKYTISECEQIIDNFLKGTGD